MIKKRSPHYDWETLKAEWIQSKETLNEFRLRKRIGNKAWFYDKVEQGGWIEARNQIISKAYQKTAEAAAAQLAQEWEKEYRLFEAADALAARVMSRHKDDIQASELAQVTRSLLNSLQGKRLIKGQSTDNVATKNYHMAIVQMLKEMNHGIE